LAVVVPCRARSISLVSSSGKKNFDAGLAPTVFSVSKYRRLIAFVSTVLATLKIVPSACAWPSAFRDRSLPLAFGSQDHGLLLTPRRL